MLGHVPLEKTCFAIWLLTRFRPSKLLRQARFGVWVPPFIGHLLALGLRRRIGRGLRLRKGDGRGAQSGNGQQGFHWGAPWVSRTPIKRSLRCCVPLHLCRSATRSSASSWLLALAGLLMLARLPSSGSVSSSHEVGSGNASNQHRVPDEIRQYVPASCGTHNLGNMIIPQRTNRRRKNRHA